MCFHEASARLRDLGCPKASELMDRAEPSVLCYLDFPAAHAKRIRTDNVQERTNRETRRRSKVVQVFPTAKSLERLVGVVMCDQDEEWQASRYFSEKKMAELYDERARTAAKTPPSPERAAELLLVAKKAIDASLELADELEAA